jgi:DNA-binding transcriptional MocR family regulator
MAEAVALAPNTVATAYRRLADRGVVVSRGRAGTFVLERPPLGIHGAPPVPEGAVDLASGSPDPRLLPSLEPHLIHTGPSLSYTDPAVLPELIDSATSWLAGQGVEPDRLTVTSGALDAIERVLTAHLRPGDAVAVERPGWSAVTDLVSALGMRSVGVATDDRGMLPDALAKCLPSVDAVVVTPRAQNPAGSAIDAKRQAELIAALDRRPDLLVVEDDHGGPVSGAPLHPLGPGRKRWAFVQSVAKALGPDLRVAFLIGDQLTLDRVMGRFGLGPGWVSRILQQAVDSMLTDEDVRSLLVTAEESYRDRRLGLIEALGAAGRTEATGRSGLNVWVPVDSEQSAVAAALQSGFVVRAGSPFGGDRPAVRVTVSNLEVDAIPRLVAALAEPVTRGGRLV